MAEQKQREGKEDPVRKSESFLHANTRTVLTLDKNINRLVTMLLDKLKRVFASLL